MVTLLQYTSNTDTVEAQKHIECDFVEQISELTSKTSLNVRFYHLTRIDKCCVRPILLVYVSLYGNDRRKLHDNA